MSTPLLRSNNKVAQPNELHNGGSGLYTLITFVFLTLPTVYCLSTAKSCIRGIVGYLLGTLGLDNYVDPWLAGWFVTTATWVLSVLIWGWVCLIWRQCAASPAGGTWMMEGGNWVVKVKLIIYWWIGRPLEVRMPRPLLPCGRFERKVWTTIDHQIWMTTDEHEYRYPALRLVNGFTVISSWIPLQYRCTTRRIDDIYVEYRLTPQEVDSSSFFAPPSSIFSSDEKGDFVYRSELRDEVIQMHLAKMGTYESLTLDSRCWEAIMHSLEATDKNSTCYTVGTIIDRFQPTMEKKEVTFVQSAVTNYWNHARSNRMEVQRNNRPNQMIQFVGDSRDDASAPYKETGRKVMPDFVTMPDAMPTKGRQSDLAAVHYRIDLVRNTVKSLTTQAQQYIDEFVALVAPDRIEPLSLEAVIEHQDGPLQRARNEKAKDMMWRVIAKVQSMVKVEAVGKQGPVRNISTLPAEFNLSLGRYMLAAADWFKKNTSWYTAGKTPKDTADRMVYITAQAMERATFFRQAKVCCADVSKMDAAKHPYIQAWLTTRIYAKLFGGDVEELLALRKSEADCKAVTAEGLTYSVGATQLSGSACTTIDNTITNAFLSYAAYRLEGKTPEESYADLGAYVGDDSVSLNSAESMEMAGKLYGYTIKAEMVGYGEHVPFLSRFFYAAWQGEPYSLQDPKRLMSKIMISTAPSEFTDAEAALNKLRGYSQLDPGVRVYSHLYDALRRIVGKDGKIYKPDMPWFSAAFTEAEGWPSSVEAQDIWTGMTGVQSSCFAAWCSGLSTYTDFMAGPPRSLIISNEGPMKMHLVIDPTEPTATAPAPEGEIPEVATVNVDRKHPGVKTAEATAAEAVLQIQKMAFVEKQIELEKAKQRTLELNGIRKQDVVQNRKGRRGESSNSPPEPRKNFDVGLWKPGTVFERRSC